MPTTVKSRTLRRRMRKNNWPPVSPRAMHWRGVGDGDADDEDKEGR
jgi:hypothetical protein